MRRILLITFALAALAAPAAAQTKISDLPAATAVTGDDLLVVVDSPASSAATKKITVTNFAGSLFSGKTTTDLAEGTNLYFTNARADGRVAAAVGVSVQAFDSDLSAVAGLSPGAGDVLQFVSGSWSSRTTAQLKTSLGLTSADVGLGSVTNDAQTKAAVVPNTAPAAGQLLVGNAGGTAYAPQAVSGDCTFASTGAVTCTKTSGASFAASATTNALNATNISSGTLAAARGGAGAVSGILKADGAGTVSAAAAGTDYTLLYSATAYNSSAFSVPNGSWTSVTWNSNDHDDNSLHSTSSNTSRVTVPSGVTRCTFSAAAEWAAAAAGGALRGVRLIRNGSTATVYARALLAPSANEVTTGFTKSLAVTGGDYYELQAYQDSGASLNITMGTQGGWLSAVCR